MILLSICCLLNAHQGTAASNASITILVSLHCSDPWKKKLAPSALLSNLQQGSLLQNLLETEITDSVAPSREGIFRRQSW